MSALPGSCSTVQFYSTELPNRLPREAAPSRDHALIPLERGTAIIRDLPVVHAPAAPAAAAAAPADAGASSDDSLIPDRPDLVSRSGSDSEEMDLGQYSATRELALFDEALAAAAATQERAMNERHAPAARRDAPRQPAQAEDSAEVEQLIRDVELVMSQAGVPGRQALEALQMHSGDIVNAIMSLTM